MVHPAKRPSPIHLDARSNKPVQIISKVKPTRTVLIVAKSKNWNCHAAYAKTSQIADHRWLIVDLGDAAERRRRGRLLYRAHSHGTFRHPQMGDAACFMLCLNARALLSSVTIVHHIVSLKHGSLVKVNQSSLLPPPPPQTKQIFSVCATPLPGIAYRLPPTWKVILFFWEIA